MTQKLIKTADLIDDHAASLQVVGPGLSHFGACNAFHGSIATLKVFEDNTLVREALESPGDGRVLVVDGGGSLRCALVGDLLAEFGVKNGWSGIVINGCIRDSAEIAQLDIGVMALATIPSKSVKRGEGVKNETVRFSDATFNPDDYLYADEDGIVIAQHALHS